MLFSGWKVWSDWWLGFSVHMCSCQVSLACFPRSLCGCGFLFEFHNRNFLNRSLVNMAKLGDLDGSLALVVDLDIPRLLVVSC